MKPTARVTLTLDRFPEIIAALPELAGEAMELSAEEIVRQAQALAPVDDGHLRDSIEARRESGEAWVVEVLAYYGLYLEYGTHGPYRIGGKFAGAQHPGVAAQPFLTPAAEGERPNFEASMRRLLEQL